QLRRNLLGVGFEKVRGALQDLRPPGDRRFAPAVERRGRGLDRGARVGGPGGLEARDDLARVRRVDVVEGLARGGVPRLAADQVLELLDLRIEDRAHAWSRSRSAAGTCFSTPSSSESGMSFATYSW